MVITQNELLQEIKLPIIDVLNDWQDYYFRNITFNDLPLEYSTFMKESTGKMLRPTIVFLISKICGEITERTYLAALLSELMHNASLVHDDIIDNSQYRHGILSFFGKYGTDRALLFGDYLVSKVLEIANKNKEYNFLSILINTFNKMSKGEIYQIEFNEKHYQDESKYLEIINYKTAALISACCEMACISSGSDNISSLCFKNFGDFIGKSYQIRDDMFDYVADVETGKTTGKDISEKLITLPLLYSLQNGDRAISVRIYDYLKDGPINDTKSSEIIRFVQNSGGIEYANKMSEYFIDKARDIIKELPYSPERNALYLLTDFIMYRKY
jgi:octaprenyl-diphosphate synthase